MTTLAQTAPACLPPARGRRPLMLMAAALLLGCMGLALIGQGVAIHAKALLAQILLERAFAESLTTGRIVKPWSWADTWPVARLDVPRISAEAIVLNGGGGQALAFGPGHLDDTAEPGAEGVAIISGHRDTHFRFLKELRLGDDIIVTRRDGVRIRFRVAELTVAPWNESGIDPTAPGRTLVLTTCWPLDSNAPGPMRYLVRAERVD